MGPDLDKEAFALLRGLRPAPAPPSLRARALAAACREHEALPLDLWIGRAFHSRLLWGTWAAAVLLALLLHPDPTPRSDATATERLRGTESLEQRRWLAGSSSRPRPDGQLLHAAPPPSIDPPRVDLPSGNGS